MFSRLCVSVLLVLSCGFISTSAYAIPSLYELSSFINSPTIGSTSLLDTRVGSGLNEFGSAGLDVSFSNNLDGDNFGTVSWSVTNNGIDLSDASFYGYLDAEITEPDNTYFNEYGDASGLTVGSGSGDSVADSWEIDEPGFPNDVYVGDIYSNMEGGSLDNTNGVPSDRVNDVSLALGFDIGDLFVSDILTATFDISATDNGGLFHYDPDSETGFYFNGWVSIERIGDAAPVPEAASIFLLAVGLAGIGAFRRKSA